MIPEKVIELAKQVGFRSASILHIYGSVDALCNSEIKELEAIQRFAELVRNQTLEEAVKSCEELIEADNSDDYKAGVTWCAMHIEGLKS